MNNETHQVSECDVWADDIVKAGKGSHQQRGRKAAVADCKGVIITVHDTATLCRSKTAPLPLHSNAPL